MPKCIHIYVTITGFCGHHSKCHGDQCTLCTILEELVVLFHFALINLTKINTPSASIKSGEYGYKKQSLALHCLSSRDEIPHASLASSSTVLNADYGKGSLRMLVPCQNYVILCN